MRRVLLTYARSPITLSLARHFKKNAFEVFVADSWRYPPSFFSKSVNKYFHVPGPFHDPVGFQNSILDISRQYQIDLVIPIFEETLYLSQVGHLFPQNTRLFTSSFDLLNNLHNKWLLTQKLQELGIDTPPTYLISTKNDLANLTDTDGYALKACYSRGSSEIIHWHPNTPIPDIISSQKKQWVAQKWLKGNAFCTYSICQNGKLLAHAAYPVGYTAQGKGCIVFTSIEHTKAQKWTENLIKKINYTGQIAFDFIETPNNLYAIECNPRATLGAVLFNDKPSLVHAFLPNAAQLLKPTENIKRQLAIGMLLYGWRTSSCPKNTPIKFLKEFLSTQDTLLDKDDILPFLLQFVSMMEMGIKSAATGLSPPKLYINDYSWNGEEQFEATYSLQNT